MDMKLEKMIQELLARIDTLERENTRLKEEIEQLKKRLSKNSRNSSKPPSSDGLSRPNKNNSVSEKGKLKSKTTKKQSGGQKGHNGSNLGQTKPDEVITKSVTSCGHCQSDLSNTKAQGYVRRQLHDLPEMPKLKVIEYCYEKKCCPNCQKYTTASFPEGINAPVQYGNNLKSYATYLQNQHFIPEQRIQQLLEDLFGVSVATASIAEFSQTCADQLIEFEQMVLDQLKNAPVKHLDETGYRIGSKTQWLHVCSNADYTYYHVSPKRKSLLSGLTGIIVHDHWKSYFTLEGISHALCNAHHLRELRSLAEDGEIWAKRMMRLLRKSCHLVNISDQSVLLPDKQALISKVYDQIVADGLKYHEILMPLASTGKRGRKKRRTGHNLLLRLRDYKHDVLRFIYDSEVPFTNNQAENDLRMMKVKQKVSGCFRSETGAQKFVRIRTLLSTARKQGWKIIDTIADAFNGKIPQFN
jgi:transposase